MTSHTKPNFDHLWWYISANLYQKYLNLCNEILLSVLHNTGSTVLLPWQHTVLQTSLILKAFQASFWRSILIFANVGSYVWSSKYISMFARVRGFVQCFSSWKLPTHWNQVDGNFKTVSCYFHILHIVLQTQMSPELMQIFANGKWRFYCSIEFHVIHVRNQGVKIWS